MRFKLYIIYAGNDDMQRALRVESFFRRYFDFFEVCYLDAFSEQCFSNKYFEFGAIANVLLERQHPRDVTFIANSTFCSGHSLIFRRYLLYKLNSYLKNQDDSGYFAFGEKVIGFGNSAYFSSYFLTLRTKPIKFLNIDISGESQIRSLRNNIPREFRYFVYGWVSYRKFLMGWHSASKSSYKTRINYRRKLVSIYYEYKLSNILLQNSEIFTHNLAASPIFKVFDRLLQLKIKVDIRYGRKK